MGVASARRTVQAWLNHKNLETTQRYLGVKDSGKLRGQIDAAFGEKIKKAKLLHPISEDETDNSGRPFKVVVWVVAIKNYYQCCDSEDKRKQGAENKVPSFSRCVNAAIVSVYPTYCLSAIQSLTIATASRMWVPNAGSGFHPSASSSTSGTPTALSVG